MATRMELLLDESRDVMRYVDRIEYSEAIDELDALVVEVSVHRTGDADTLVNMLTPGAAFKVELYDAGTLKNEGVGDLVEVRHHRRQTGAYDIVAVGLDGLHRLRNSKPAELVEGTTKDAVAAIATRHSLTLVADDVDTTESWQFMDDQDDAIYLRNFARAHNYYVRVVDTDLKFKKRVVTGAVTATWGEDILELSMRTNIEGQVSKVTVMGFDMLQEADVKGEAALTDLKKISGGDTGANIAKTAFGETELIVNQSHYTQVTDAKAHAVAELQRRAERFVEGTCVVIGNPAALSGAKLTIENAGWPMSGDFLIRQTRHVQDTVHGYRTYIDFISDSLPTK